ncbi:MAG: hypothetical protein LBU34_06495 [Planctomycetaceae bacterium]|nr:hypothetical protein [Planctomycetaceae bacterium]
MTVYHVPFKINKWNEIEHRLFSLLARVYQ